jgi:hypothetical protein
MNITQNNIKKNSKKYSKKNTSKTNITRNNITNIGNIQKNINTIKHKLEEKDMINIFWVIADRSDFRPLTRIMNDKYETKTVIHSVKELRDNLLDEKGEYYKGKKIASIHINFDDTVINKLDKIQHGGIINKSLLSHKDYIFIKDKPILNIEIVIYPIDEFGNINTNNNSSWGLKVNYFIDDFSNIKFKLKNIEVLMRLACDSIVKTNLRNGITYKDLVIQLGKNK